MRLLSIIIPTLNEGDVVKETIKSIPIKKLKSIGIKTEILVVDGGSVDNTVKEAKDAGANIIYEPKRGYGIAYLTGLNQAKGDIIIFADADGTYPLEISDIFIKPILDNKADFVIGSRTKGKILPGAMPWLHRYIGNPLLTFVLNLLFNARISDTHSGMRALTRNALNRLNLKTHGMEFASEMIIEAVRKKLRIVEVPIEYRPRKGGKTKLKSFQDGWRHLRFMFLYSPTVLFLIPGALLFLIGSILMILLSKGTIYIANIGLDIHSMVLGSLFVILGFQIMVLGIYGKMYAAIHNMVEPDRTTRFFLRYESLDWGIFLGIILFLTGVWFGFGILMHWVGSGFGAISELRGVITASTLAILGVQMIFSSLFISMLLLDKSVQN